MIPIDKYLRQIYNINTILYKEKKMANYDRLIELDEKIKERYPNKVVLDGVVNHNIFIKKSPKILWILKEANASEDAFKNEVFELNASLDEDVTAHDNWKSTWGLVMEISYSIFHKAKVWEEEVPLVDVLAKEGTIKNIAIINVKKPGGGSVSDQGVINEYYKKDKDIILAQIEAIAPDIIINCSRVDALFNDIRTTEPNKVNQFYIANFKNGIIINAYHPNNREIKHEQYFINIRDCLNQG